MIEGGDMMAKGGEILGCQGQSAIIIGGATALELIRREDLAPLIAYSERVPARALACKIVAPTQQQAARLLDAFECSAPLHCVVEDTGDRRRGAVRCQILRPVRQGDVIMLDRGLYLLSPELLYLQLSRGMDVAQLWMLASELTARYGLDTRAEVSRQHIHRASAAHSKRFEEADCSPSVSEQADGASNSLFERAPLTTPEALRTVVESAGHGPRSLSHRVASLVLGGARSPKEAQLAALLALPRRLGGRGISGMELNHVFELPRQAQVIAGRRAVEGDLYIPGIRRNIEYDSEQHHSDSEQRDRDIRKANALRAIGVDVRTVTRTQLYTWNVFNALADSLARGTVDRARPVTASLKTLQYELWHNLLVRDEERD